MQEITNDKANEERVQKQEPSVKQAEEAFINYFFNKIGPSKESEKRRQDIFN